MIDDKLIRKIMSKITECLQDVGVLLYACFVGSRLHGTNTETSDYDVRFVYLPHKNKCLLGEAQYVVNADMKWENIDMQGWSIVKFMELLNKSDTLALDLVFSKSYPDMVIFDDPRLKPIFDSPEKFMPMNELPNMLSYIASQASKYGDRGLHLEAHRRALKAAEDSGFEDTDLLANICKEVVQAVNNQDLCRIVFTANNSAAILITGKYRMLGIPIGEFKKCMRSAIDSYGARTNKILDGTDWKALAHALRCIYEVQELLSTGVIIFPLNASRYLLEVRQGMHDISSVREELTAALRELREEMDLRQDTQQDWSAYQEFILGLYGRKDTASRQEDS